MASCKTLTCETVDRQNPTSKLAVQHDARRASEIRTRAMVASLDLPAQNLAKVWESPRVKPKPGRLQPRGLHYYDSIMQQKRAVRWRHSHERGAHLRSEEGPVSSRLRSSGCVLWGGIPVSQRGGTRQYLKSKAR